MMPLKRKSRPERHAPEEVDEYLGRRTKTGREALDTFGETVRFAPEAPLAQDLVERIVRDRRQELGKEATS